MAKSDSPIDIAKALEKMGATVTNDIGAFDSPYYVRTGLWSLDFIISAGRGLPTGVIEYYGGESSGKTTAALQAMANAQALGMPCFYINAERALTKSLVDSFPGIDTSKVQWIDPDGGEAALNAIKLVLKNYENAFVVLDSIPACLPKDVLDEEAGKSNMARLARLFSPVMPDFKRLAWKSKSVVLLVNQMRDNISPMGYKPIKPGGHAISFYSDVVVRFRVTKKLKSGDDTIGHEMTSEVEKTRGQGIGKKAVSTLIYGNGFVEAYDVLDLALSLGMVTKSGAWYKFDEETKAQGKEGAVALLCENQDMFSKLESQVLEMIQ